MNEFLLIVAGLTTILAAVGVVVSKEAVTSALFLTVHLLGVGSLFLALTHQFLAVAQLLVYAGAVMVVFLFAVTTLSPNEPPVRLFEKTGVSAAGVLAGLGVFGALTMGLKTGLLDGLPIPTDHKLSTVESFAMDLFGPYLLPFEGTAFLLLVALIGAMILGGRRQIGDG